MKELEKSLDAQAGLSTDCSNYLLGLPDRFSGKKPMMPADRAFALYSGRGLNEMGLFKDCVEEPDVAFYNLQIGPDLLRYCFGVCLSTLCSSGDW